MKKSLCIFLIFLWIIFPAVVSAAEPAPERPYFGIALIGDPHLPGKELPSKKILLRTIDGWGDIDRVVVLGDICKTTGTAKEYDAAKAFFRRLHKPLRPITGNHDYIYDDEENIEGRKLKASPATRRKKLARFSETFGLKKIYSSERLGNYLMIYLSVDDLQSERLAQLSTEQLTWLTKELAGHRDLPTIIFFHAPLDGTLPSYNTYANTPSFVAQPAVRLYALIRENPQLFLWVAGHMHVPATNENYASPINVYQKQVTVIHNADLERKRPWTNVLYLYPEKIVVQTFDHWLNSWRLDLERTIRLPGR